MDWFDTLHSLKHNKEDLHNFNFWTPRANFVMFLFVFPSLVGTIENVFCGWMFQDFFQTNFV